jgi:hypothetical protein
MITCPKCGTQNEDGSDFCKKCGTSLHVAPPVSEYRRPREECFGVPNGGAIIGLVFGAILISLGLGIIFGFDVARYIGPFILIVIGLLIVLGALYGYSRRSGRW